MLPLHVIHHLVVLTFASLIVTWSLALWPKFALIVDLASAITLTMYDIRGLGPIQRPQPAMSRA